MCHDRGSSRSAATSHGRASLLLCSGVSMKDIQVWLGHSDYSTTANIYAHLSMDDSIAAIKNSDNSSAVYRKANK